MENVSSVNHIIEHNYQKAAGPCLNYQNIAHSVCLFFLFLFQSAAEIKCLICYEWKLKCAVILGTLMLSFHLFFTVRGGCLFRGIKSIIGLPGFYLYLQCRAELKTHGVSWCPGVMANPVLGLLQIFVIIVVDMVGLRLLAILCVYSLGFVNIMHILFKN